MAWLRKSAPAFKAGGVMSSLTMDPPMRRFMKKIDIMADDVSRTPPASRKAGGTSPLHRRGPEEGGD